MKSGTRPFPFAKRMRIRRKGDTDENSGKRVVVFEKLFQKRAVAAALACAVCLCVAIPSVFAIMNVSNGEPCAVVLEINPGVLFLTDKKGNVTGVKSLNSDADVILVDEDVANELEGKPLAESAEIFIDYALKLGFFDYESDENAIKFTAEKDLPFIEESVTAAENYFRKKAYIPRL